MPKRVWTLYRVSTKSQLNKDEIPTQRKACLDYINRQKDWVLTREVSEKGVSAFKNKAADREALNEILKGAMNKEFDILLIYKADRLGRLFMDTPLFLYELYQYGVLTYSTVENYLDVSTHNSRLMVGFIFWQSEGESQSTSQRVSDFMEQYNEEGKFMGGAPPIGYKVIATGKPHWKNKDKVERKLVIDEKDAPLVKEIFQLVYEKGYGATRIANYFNSKNIKTRSGAMWRSNVISRILRNPVYIGYKRYNIYNKDGTLKNKEEFKFQPKNPELIIVDEDVFWKVQEIIDNRKNNKNKSNNDKISIPTSSKLLFSGIARCGYCKNKLKADYSVKTYKRKTDGEITKMKTSRYTCMNARENKLNHPTRHFSAKKFEHMIMDQIFKEINLLDLAKIKEEMENNINNKINLLKLNIKNNKQAIIKCKKEIDALKEEVTKVLLGESNFDSKLLQELIDKKQNQLNNLINEGEKLASELEEIKVQNKSEQDVLEIYKSFKDKFEQADISSKKMMFSNIIDELYLYKDRIEIKLNL